MQGGYFDKPRGKYINYPPKRVTVPILLSRLSEMEMTFVVGGICYAVVFYKTRRFLHLLHASQCINIHNMSVHVSILVDKNVLYFLPTSTYVFCKLPILTVRYKIILGKSMLISAKKIPDFNSASLRV